MNISIKITLVLMFLHLFAVLSAQTRIGYVTNRDGEAVEFATIILSSDNKHVATAISDSLGKFSVSINDGEYHIKIRNIAYETLEKDIIISTKSIDLGIFNLQSGSLKLGEVVVSTSAIVRQSDRFVMYIRNVPSFSNKDASEILRLAPGIWIDDNGISINGAEGSKVYINDRELKLTGKELANYLRNYRSSDIAHIEIIPQSGAEYSADSKGGIIRITLQKQSENGIMGNVMFETLEGKYLSAYNPSGTLNVQIARWTLNAYASGEIIGKGKNELIATRNYKNGEDAYFESQSFMNQKTKSGIGRIGVIYDLDKKNSFGTEIEYISKNIPNPSSAKTVIKQNGLTINNTSSYEQNEHNSNFSILFNYNYKMDTIGSSFKFIADYTDKKVIGDNDYHSSFEVLELVTDSIYRNNTSSRYKVLTVDAMISKKLAKSVKYLVGVKHTFYKMSDTVGYESYYKAAWNQLDEYSFSLNYTENISAAYGALNIDGNKLSLSVGLRAENTYITNNTSKINRTYLDFFPNVSATYTFNAMRTFMLIGQYSRNIQRPNFWHLNPNRIQYSDYSYMVGNPNLRPTYINNIGITAVYKYKYILSIGGRLHRDLIREVSKIDPDNPEVTYITPENHFIENHYYAALSVPLQILKWCNINTNFTGVKQDIRGSETDNLMSHNLYFANITAGFTLPAKLYLELTYNGASRMYSANSGINPRHLFHIVLKKQFLNNQLSTSLGLNNVFNSKASYFSNTEYFKIDTNGYEAWSSRYIKLNVQYNFNSGKTIKKRAIENMSDSEKNRIEKSSK